MRIIGKNNDYYDSVRAYGADPSVVFERKTVKHKDIRKFSPELEKYFQGALNLSRARRKRPEAFVVIFCGKIYYGIKLYVDKSKEEVGIFDWCIDRYIEICCYSTEDVIKTLEKDSMDVERVFASKTYKDGRVMKLSAKRKLDLFFENNKSEKFMNLAIEKRCPILLIESVDCYGNSLRITENPILKDVSFFKLFDPYTTYQELSMFVGGVLARESKPIIEISDEDMIIKKGFNKWSFRKMKES